MPKRLGIAGLTHPLSTKPKLFVPTDDLYLLWSVSFLISFLIDIKINIDRVRKFKTLNTAMVSFVKIQNTEINFCKLDYQ